MLRRPGRVTSGYVLILIAAFLIALTAGWTGLASGMDRYAYDWMSRVQPAAPRDPDCVVLAFDEQSLSTTGGMTKRLDRLEARGLVRREADPHDRRGRPIAARIYARARPLYHPLVTGELDDLKLGGGSASRLAHGPPLFPARNDGDLVAREPLPHLVRDRSVRG